MVVAKYPSLIFAGLFVCYACQEYSRISLCRDWCIFNSFYRDAGEKKECNAKTLFWIEILLQGRDAKLVFLNFTMFGFMELKRIFGDAYMDDPCLRKAA